MRRELGRKREPVAHSVHAAGESAYAAVDTVLAKHGLEHFDDRYRCADRPSATHHEPRHRSRRGHARHPHHERGVVRLAGPGVLQPRLRRVGELARLGCRPCWRGVHRPKDVALFSMLFGAGIVVFADRAEAKGNRPAMLSLWRNALLLGIGLAHQQLWFGDILTVYALCSPVRLGRPRRDAGRWLSRHRSSARCARALSRRGRRPYRTPWLVITSR